MIRLTNLIAASLFWLMCFCGLVIAQQNPDQPETFTFEGPWTFAHATQDQAEMHVRDHRVEYVAWPALNAASDRDVSAASWSIVNIEYKTQEGSKHYPWRARAVIQVTVASEVPEEGEPENSDSSEGAEVFPGDPEDWQEAITSDVTEAAVADMIGKIADVETRYNGLVTALTRLSGSAAAKGLWAGVKSTDRYLSRLSDMMRRVDDARNKITNLQDGQWRQVETVFGKLLDDLDSLHYESETTEYFGNEDDYEIAKADYEWARIDLAKSVWSAKQTAKWSTKTIDTDLARVRFENDGIQDLKARAGGPDGDVGTLSALKAQLAEDKRTATDAAGQISETGAGENLTSIDADGVLPNLRPKPGPLSETARQSTFDRLRAEKAEEDRIRQEELSRQRQAQPSDAEIRLTIQNLEIDYLQAELERVAISPDSMIYAAVFLWDEDMIYDFTLRHFLSYDDVIGECYRTPIDDDCPPLTDQKRNAFAHACLERTGAFNYVYEGGLSRKCIYFDPDEIRAALDDRDYGYPKQPFALISRIVAVPFDSAQPYSSLQHDDTWQGFWSPYSALAGDRTYTHNNEFDFCQFSGSTLEGHVSKDDLAKADVPILPDGNAWALCHYGTQTDETKEKIKYLRFHVLANPTKTVLVSRNKQDLLDLASIMGPILGGDFSWPDWPENPRALDLSQQEELEARMRALSEG